MGTEFALVVLWLAFGLVLAALFTIWWKDGNKAIQLVLASTIAGVLGVILQLGMFSDDAEVAAGNTDWYGWAGLPTWAYNAPFVVWLVLLLLACVVFLLGRRDAAKAKKQSAD